MSDFLYTVPKIVFCHLLTSWLSLSEVGRLDSSLCVKDCRQLFESVLSKWYAPVVPQKLICYDDWLIRWIIRHKIQVREVTVEGILWCDEKLRYLLLEVIGSSLKKLRICQRPEDPYDMSRPEDVLYDVSILCTGLEELSVYEHHDRGICAVLARNPKLRTMFLSHCPKVLESVGLLCPNIQRLTENEASSNETLRRFGDNLPLKIVELRIPRSNLTVSDARNLLLTCKQLRTLHIRNCMGESPLERLAMDCAGTQVTYFRMKYTDESTSRDVKYLAKIMPHLQTLVYLYTYNTQWRHNVLSAIEHLPSLRQYVSCGVFEDMFQVLSDPALLPAPTEQPPGTSALQELLVSSQDFHFAGSLPTVLSLCPQLQTIGFDRVPLTEDSEPQLALCSASGVHKLFIAQALVTDRDVLGVRGLTELRVTGTADMENSALVGLAQRCPNLQQLELRDAPLITAWSIFQVMSLCPRLHTLVISSCNYTGDLSESESMLATACKKLYPNLRKVGLYFNR